MLKIIKISSFEELDLCLKHGINPLFWHRYIKLDIHFRIDVQNKLFGKSELGKTDVLIANDKYYHYCYQHSVLHCENCGARLYARRNIDDLYSSVFISHILSRSSMPEMAHDPRNHNILCPRCHAKWESPNNREMLIYMDNHVVINEMIEDYNKLRNFS